MFFNLESRVDVTTYSEEICNFMSINDVYKLNMVFDEVIQAKLPEIFV